MFMLAGLSKILTSSMKNSAFFPMDSTRAKVAWAGTPATAITAAAHPAFRVHPPMPIPVISPKSNKNRNPARYPRKPPYPALRGHRLLTKGLLDDDTAIFLEIVPHPAQGIHPQGQYAQIIPGFPGSRKFPDQFSRQGIHFNGMPARNRSEEHTSELQSQFHL